MLPPAHRYRFAPPSMSSNPLVSIVVAFYNPPEFMFKEALDSIRAQSFVDWEVLLVDDGSTNQAGFLARQWEQGDPQRIRYLRHAEGGPAGVAAARNMGIREARGRYVAFLDADDVWLPHKLERQLESLRQHPEALMTYCGFTYWHGWTGLEKDVAQDRPNNPWPMADGVVEPVRLIRHYLRDRCIPGVGGMLVERALAGQVGGFEESLSWAEDQTLPYRIALYHPVYVSSELLWKYRRHPMSTTTAFQVQGQRNRSQLKFLRWVERFFREEGVRDRSLWRALRLWQIKYRKSLLKEQVMNGQFFKATRSLLGMMILLAG